MTARLLSCLCVLSSLTWLHSQNTAKPILVPPPMLARARSQALKAARATAGRRNDKLARQLPTPRVAALPGAANPIFQVAPTYASAGLLSLSAAVADLNGDGKPDVVIADYCFDLTCTTGSVSVLLGNGDGTFQTAVSYPSGALHTFFVVVGDFNGDGKPDLAVANDWADNTLTSGSVSVLLGNGDGTFQTPVTYLSGASETESLAVGDFNGDGKLDLAATDLCLDSTCAKGAVSVFLGKGDGTFQAPVIYSSGILIPTAIAMGDFNGDHKPDLVVTQLDDNDQGSVGVLLGKGDGTFEPALAYLSGATFAQTVAIGDFNGDGKLDLVVGHRNGNGPNDGVVGVLLGNGDGTFQPPANYASGGGAAYSVVAGDFNGDGKLDLVAGNLDSTIGVLLGKGDGTFQEVVSYLSATDVGFAVAGDFNRDNKLDVAEVGVVGGNENGYISVLLGKGDGTFVAPHSYATGGVNVATSFAVTGDLNKDGNSDLVVSCSDQATHIGSVAVLLGNGDGTLQSFVSYPTLGLSATGVAVGDFDGNGKLDVAAAVGCSDASCTNGALNVFLGNGDGTLQPAMSYLLQGMSPSFVKVGDFNNDGKPDLVLTGSCFSTGCASGLVSVLLGKGDGTFKTAITFDSGGLYPGSVGAGDFNGDGKLDLAVQNGCTDINCTNGTVSVMLGNGDGTFKPPVNYLISWLAVFVAVGDFNRDGKLDLAMSDACFETAMCSPTDGPISVLLGKGDGTFQTAVGYGSGLGGGTFLAAKDFDGDTNPDLAVGSGGNLALLLGNGDGSFVTTSYNADGTAAGIDDFNGDSKPDMALLNVNRVSVLLNIAAGFPTPDFTIVGSALFPSTVSAGGSATSTITVTAMSGFNSAVSLSCSGLPVGAVCSFKPTSVTPGGVPGTSSLTISTSVLTPKGTFSVSLTGISGSVRHTTTVTLTVQGNQTPGFSIGASPTSASVHPGSSAPYTISVTPQNGFSSLVSLTCSVPSNDKLGCSFNPTSITPGTNSTLTVTTTAPTAALLVPGKDKLSLIYTMWLPFPAITLAGFGLRRRRLGIGLMCVLLAMTLLLASCGGGSGGSPGTPVGSYSIVVTATSGSLTQTTDVTLSVQ